MRIERSLTWSVDGKQLNMVSFGLLLKVAYSEFYRFLRFMPVIKSS